jgi:mRNA interferase YafQ
MHKQLGITSECKRDLKRASKRGLDMNLFERVIALLQQGDVLPAQHRDHALKGKWIGWRDCHIQNDWVLVYRTTEVAVYLTRTGSHSDIFGR